MMKRMGKHFSKRRYKFLIEEMEELLEFIFPQKFEDVISAFQTALRQLDSSWQIGQFEVFSRHFHNSFFRSFFTQRFLLNDSKCPIVIEEKILEQFLQASRSFDDEKKAAFYGAVLTEYILRCPDFRFPDRMDDYKGKANRIIVSNLHSEVWHRIYW